MKIKYFPVKDTLSFTILMVAVTIITMHADLNLWILPIVAIFVYMITLKNATIIRLSDTLKIISFNPLWGSHSINIKSITKVSSIETFEQKSHRVFGGSYFLFTRKYMVEYLNKKGSNRTAFFLIANIKQEKEIISALEKQRQSF